MAAVRAMQDGFTTDQAGAAGIPEGTPPGQMQGFLTKQGHFRKTWKKRWFVLEWPHLYYYKEQTDALGGEPVRPRASRRRLFIHLVWPRMRPALRPTKDPWWTP